MKREIDETIQVFGCDVFGCLDINYYVPLNKMESEKDMKSTMKRFLLPLLFAVCFVRVGYAQTYPLSVSENHRYFVTVNGEPHIILADTAWSLFAGISKEDVCIYLNDRQAKGFNTILCSALHFWPDGQSAWKPQHSVYGWWAFAGDRHGLTDPTTEYWDHVEWVIRQAEKRNMLLMIVPCWFRSDKGGWYSHITQENARVYGRFLANRFRSYKNIIWMLGGDHEPEANLKATNVLGNALKKHAPRHLISYHANGLAGPSSQWFGNEAWFDFSTIQTHYERHPREYKDVLKDYRSKPILPTWNSEPRYEFSPDRDRKGLRIGAFLMRQQAYRAFLSGAFGVSYGVYGLFNIGLTELDWKTKLLPLPGSFDMGHWKALVKNRPWHKLKPDDGSLLIGHSGKGEDYIPCAVSTSKDFALAYFPKTKSALFDLSQINDAVIAHWFDPSNGAYHSLKQSPFLNKNEMEFTPPGRNAGGDNDFVLVLQAKLRK